MLWFIWIVVVLVVLAFFKLEHLSRIARTLILVIILAILFFSISYLLKEGKIDFSSPKSSLNSFVIYGQWLEERGKVFFNATKESVKFIGNVIKNT